MQRRTFLLFGLFVVTAWFYSSVANSGSRVANQNHPEQVQVLHESGATADSQSPPGEQEAED